MLEPVSPRGLVMPRLRQFRSKPGSADPGARTPQIGCSPSHDGGERCGLFADEAYASPTCTSFRMPARVDARNLARVLRDDYDTIIAGGQGKLEGQIARVGHMGFVTLQDMLAFLSAIEFTLKDFNQPVEPGAAIVAALRAYAEATQPPAKTPVGSRR